MKNYLFCVCPLGIGIVPTWLNIFADSDASAWAQASSSGSYGTVFLIATSR